MRNIRDVQRLFLKFDLVAIPLALLYLVALLAMGKTIVSWPSLLAFGALVALNAMSNIGVLIDSTGNKITTTTSHARGLLIPS